MTDDETLYEKWEKMSHKYCDKHLFIKLVLQLLFHFMSKVTTKVST